MPRASVIIPAHNEASVIGQNLEALLADAAPGEFEVIVVCNGCRDATAAVARACRYPVRVLELGAASKAMALRAGDAAATTCPRIYLDADIRLGADAMRQVVGRLANGAIAARPPLRYDTAHATSPVRRYYQARARVPAVLRSLWGAGIYGLSEAGRGRFETFPDVVADDLWVDGQFTRDEVEIIDCSPVVVTVPMSTRDLFRILRRTYKGKAEVVDPVGRRRPATTASIGRDLWRAAQAGPAEALDALFYAGFAVTARLTLGAQIRRRRVKPHIWERDDSSRLRIARRGDE